MLGKNQIKLITGLRQKKFRDREGLFFAEGPKVIAELHSAGFKLEKWYAVPGFSLAGLPEPEPVFEAELAKISSLTTPNQCLALFQIPVSRDLPDSDTTVLLDDVRDPGNLGTIVRLCDWFGVTRLVCSPHCADVYNPKVVQATMGSLARVEVSYMDLAAFATDFDGEIVGTFMDGESIYDAPVGGKTAIIMGNEANGISHAVEKLCDRKISVPRFGAIQKAESLNVATAAAIILGEVSRRSSVGKK